MTFEQKYKDLLKTDLEAIFGAETSYNKRITVANDINSNGLDYVNSLLAVVKTGQGIRSEIPDYNAIDLPIFISFYFDQNDLQPFLSELNEYIDNQHNKTFNVEINEVTYFYRLRIDSPFVMNGNLDLNCKEDKETITATIVNLIVNCFISTTPISVPASLKFKYGYDEYTINNIIRYTFVHEPVVDTSQELESDISKKDIIGYETTYEIDIVKDSNDTFCNLLTNVFKGTKINHVFPLSLIIDNVEVTIQKVTITEGYENNQSILKAVMLV